MPRAAVNSKLQASIKTIVKQIYYEGSTYTYIMREVRSGKDPAKVMYEAFQNKIRFDVEGGKMYKYAYKVLVGFATLIDWNLVYKALLNYDYNLDNINWNNINV